MLRMTLCCSDTRQIWIYICMDLSISMCIFYLDIKFLGYHFSALKLQSGEEEKSEDSLTVIHLQVTVWTPEEFFPLFLELKKFA